MYRSVTLKSAINKYWKTTVEMIGGYCLIPEVSLVLMLLQLKATFLANPLLSISTNKFCPLMVKAMHGVRRSHGPQCHHPLFRSHIKPGDKICKIWEKTPRRRTDCWFWVVHWCIYASILENLAVSRWELLRQGNGQRNVNEE